MRISIILSLLTILCFVACEEGVIAPDTQTEVGDEREISYEELTTAQFQRFLGVNSFFRGIASGRNVALSNETGFCYEAGSFACTGSDAQVYVSRIADCQNADYTPSFILHSPTLATGDIDATFQPGEKQFATFNNVCEVNGFEIDMDFFIEQPNESDPNAEASFKLVSGSTSHGAQDVSKIEILKRERYLLTDKEQAPFVDLITFSFDCSMYDDQGNHLGFIEAGTAVVKSPYYSIQP